MVVNQQQQQLIWDMGAPLRHSPPNCGRIKSGTYLLYDHSSLTYQIQYVIDKLMSGWGAVVS